MCKRYTNLLQVSVKSLVYFVSLITCTLTMTSQYKNNFHNTVKQDHALRSNAKTI